MDLSQQLPVRQIEKIGGSVSWFVDGFYGVATGLGVFSDTRRLACWILSS
jgi:hypothetical protein